MAAPAPVVGLVGWRALRIDLLRLADDNGELARAMAEAGKKAAFPVAITTRGTLPRDTGTLAGDVRVTASRTGAAVRMGRVTVPYAGWIEFGGTRHNPWESSRPYVKDGRYLFPAARQMAGTAAALYSDGLQRALDDYDWSNRTANPKDVHD